MLNFFPLAEETSMAEKTPKSLTKEKVQQWFEKAIETLEIDIQEVSNLKLLNGKALNMLEKEDWIRRSPSYGDILFNMWQKDQQTFTETDRTKEHDEGNGNGKLLSMIVKYLKRTALIFNTIIQ